MLKEDVNICFETFLKMRDLKHSLSEDHFVLLPPPLQDDVAEVREVDESVPWDSVTQVHDILLHWVQSQHLHSTQKVLGNISAQFMQFILLKIFSIFLYAVTFLI